jgi:hypothetical protein
VILVDRLLIGGLSWVLDKVAVAASRELEDDGSLRELLLEAQLRAELGEIDEDELAAIESEVVARLREVRRARGDEPVTMDPANMRVTGVEASFVSDEELDGR